MNRSRPASRLASLACTVSVVAAGLSAASCAPDKMPFPESETHVFAGGVEVTGHTLNEGYQSYTRYCYACHGVKGDGQGPSSYGLRPPPRDFTKGIFKFARVRSSDDLPNDEDLVRIVKGGLHGTAMLPWDIPEMELHKVIQYIKTFAPQKWEKKKKSGEPVKTLEPFEATEDPWAGNHEAAVQEGKVLYHFRAECLNCHPAYDTKENLYKLSVEAAAKNSNYKAIGGFRDDPYGSVAKDSAEYKSKILPPDFTFNPVRSVREKHELEDLYRIISFGVYPIMPAWKGAGLSDKDIWALAHYVKSLVDMRNTKDAADMKAKFASQKAFEVPKAEEKPAEEKPAEAAAAEGDKKADDKKADDKKADDKKAGDKKTEKKEGK